jgi:hypothetical protein
LTFTQQSIARTVMLSHPSSKNWRIQRRYTPKGPSPSHSIGCA